MKKVSCEQQGSDVKMSKKGISKREIKHRNRFPFNRSYFQFYTPIKILSSYVNSIREIVIVFCISMNSPCYHIYTIDGYLISTFSCDKLDMNMIKSVQMFFSDRMLILLVSLGSSYMHELIQLSEYTYARCNFWSPSNVCFDCDQDYVYVIRAPLKNCIDMYTHDLQLTRTIFTISGINLDMRVQNDSIFLLNKPSPKFTPNRNLVTKLIQLSLSSGELIQTFYMYYNSYPYPKCISSHPLGHVIIGYTSTERLSILYHDGIVRYDDVTSVDHSFTVSYMATTVTGDLVCAPYSGRCIRVYPAV